MPTMEVDGKKVAWEGKKMILQACNDVGIELPVPFRGIEFGKPRAQHLRKLLR